MKNNSALRALSEREEASSDYWRNKDFLSEQRLRWRAQAIRHTFHVLPGESILDLGCGIGQLGRTLTEITRGESPVTSATFCKVFPSLKGQIVQLSDFPGELAGKKFDYIVGSNLLDMENAGWILKGMKTLLKPGGGILLFETNPWNPVFVIRRKLGQFFPRLSRPGERFLPSRVRLYEILSEMGFISVRTNCYDFLYPPIPKKLMWAARHLSLILENTPFIQQFAGTILVHAISPPRRVARNPVRIAPFKNLHNRVSVVIPCHNEEMNITGLIEGLTTHYGDYIKEFILVEDNSTDRTADVLKKLAAKNPKIRPIFRKPPGGVGLALADGFKAATGDYVLSMDCDFVTILPELHEMFHAANEDYDVIVGSRFSRDSVLIHYPLMKILCNRFFHLLARLVLRRGFRDLTNNLKLMKREVVERLNLESANFAVNAETGLKPLLMGYRLKEVPISWVNRGLEMGKSSFSLVSNGLGYVKVLFRLAYKLQQTKAHGGQWLRSLGR